MEHLQQIANHLEFLGYELKSREDSGYGARHEKHWNFVFANKVGGVLIQFFIGVEDGHDEATLHRYVNDLNKDAVVTRFFIDGDGDFAGEAWWPPMYDKVKFGTFLEAWHHDGALVARHESSREILA